MRGLDRLLQLWRMKVASRHVPNGSRILDIGCHHGEFLRLIQSRIGRSVGIDPLARRTSNESYVTMPLPFSEPLPFTKSSFDVITLLATLEHIQDTDSVARECYRLLRQGGKVVATIPSVVVDEIVSVLIRLKLADGMSLDQHFGLEPSAVPDKFCNEGFSLMHHRRFQLGANHLMIFQKQRQSHGESGVILVSH